MDTLGSDRVIVLYADVSPLCIAIKDASGAVCLLGAYLCG